MKTVWRTLGIVIFLLSCIEAVHAQITPVLTQPIPAAQHSVREEGILGMHGISQSVDNSPQAVIAVRDEIARRDQAATERWKQLRRERFIEDILELDQFSTFLATIPMDATGPAQPAAVILRQRGKEIEKMIPRIVEYVGGKSGEGASGFSLAMAPDTVVDILSRLTRSTIKLFSIAKQKYPDNPTGNDDLITDLNVVRTILKSKPPKH